MISTGIKLAKGVSLSAALVTFLCGCGHDHGDSSSDGAQGKFGSSSYVVVNEGNLKRKNSEIKGTGTFVFKQPIGEIGSNRHYDLDFNLEDGGSLTLVAHGDNKLNRGVEVVFSRKAEALELTFAASGSESSTRVVKGIPASGAIHVGVDVHNEESPAHILIWSGNNYSEDAALFNSEEDNVVPGKGSATFWGLKLIKARVTKAAISSAKFTEAH